MGELFFWISFIIIFYTYIGYGILLFLLVRIVRSGKNEPVLVDENDLPTVTIVVPAYNEEAFIKEKVKNLKEINYPAEKLELVFVTDGSNDGTYEILSKMDQIKLYHKPERNGKTTAINRIMPFIKSDITVFNDANTMINKDAIYNLARHFLDNDKVGSVAGEKRISSTEADIAIAAGEGFYWKYESFLKKLDSKLYSTMGAAGELFAIRTVLYNYPSENIIIEDFVVTLSTFKNGYVIKYEPDAYAVEKASVSVKEEMKRKIRIAAGGIQATILLKDLCNIFKYGWISFQFVSHRVLRWSLTPLLLPLLFILNVFLMFQQNSFFYTILFALQCLFYLFGFMGYFLQSKKTKFKIFFIPYYFFMMNYAVYAGFIRFITGKQSAVWERAKRAT